MSRVKDIQVFHHAPQDFTPKVEVAAVYVEVGKEVLFLQRASSEKGLWGVPAGKVEAGESAESAAKRELLEEAGIALDGHSRFDSLGKLFIRKPHIDYIYHMHRLILTKKPIVTLSPEHQESQWISLESASDLPLMAGALEAFLHYKDMGKNRVRTGTNVNAYLILKKENQILLHLRENTGYYDGYYGLVSGHVEEGESAQAGLIREAQEEAGISLNAKDLHFAYCLHRQTNRLNIDLFFTCTSWEGEITNREPEKCAALQFFPPEEFPINMIGYIKQAIMDNDQGKYYSEQGWNS